MTSPEDSRPFGFDSDQDEMVNAMVTDYTAANAIVNSLAEEFFCRLPDDMARIEDAMKTLQANPDDPSARKQLFRLVHDLKGQTGTFGYDLLTVIGNDLCRFLERPMPLCPRSLRVIRLHLDAMQRVSDLQLTGHGDAFGRRMVDTVHALTQKILQTV
ncbi:MAG: Hpt domain-containing protein [Alphaproteobacteria bacterium]|nr:Hpt domain-containing protein [Alphaproteobacteria bacterium]